MADCKALTEKAELYKDNINAYLERGARLLSTTTPTNQTPLEFWRLKVSFINSNISGANGEIKRAQEAVAAQIAAGCTPTNISNEIAKTKSQQTQLEALKARAEAEVQKLTSEGGLCIQIADKANLLDKSTPALYDKFRTVKDTVLRKITGPSAASEYQQASEVAAKLASDAAKIAASAKDLKAQAEKNGCPRDTIDDISDIINRASYLETEGNDYSEQALDKAKEASGSTPKSEPVTVPNANGVPSTQGDGLEEVTVTGKRGATGPAVITLIGEGDVAVTEPTINFGQDTSSDPGNTNNGLPGDVSDAQAEASYQDTVNFQKKEDWRVRLSLSPGADYLYKAQPPGILAPLNETDGVIFPYTPVINVNYTASYDATNLTHSNYKIYQYQSSSVDSITIACDFTAQDTYEANYMLAVIHFFRSLTKMFYGQDELPKPGTPPPLVYLFGLGAFQFEAHPLVITNFSYNLPADVDYIRATNSFQNAGINQSPGVSKGEATDPSQQRLASGGGNLAPGGKTQPTNFPPSRDGTNDPTYVPTKINISLSAYPIVSRYDISRNFSVKKYATGELLRGTVRPGGGMW
jgi:hypothetical protein